LRPTGNAVCRFGEAYYAELQDWIEAAKEGKVNGPNAWDGYLANATADALARAQETGQVEKIETGACLDSTNNLSEFS
jgi:myo-inositol 2-dehydrogenase/D-chiro-inositol 1-dehydrogenase